ncbi:MAG: DUF4445 domain-containing protein [Deltaproteobacteria bacterium]|nr:DUF4445 domain-containing protein [Deltaproteobacteria bacterium]
MAARPKNALVVFTPSGKRARFALGTPLLLAARELGVDIDSVCGGLGICGRCKIVPAEGDFAAYGIRSARSHLSRFSDPEKRYAMKNELGEAQRLACHARVRGDCVIDVPASSQVHHQVVRKDYQHLDIEVNPLIRIHHVRVEPPRLDRPRGDLERLLDALEREWQLPDLAIDPRLLPGLQGCLREGEFCVSAALRDEREIVALWPGLKGRVYGVAVDVGSTTIAAHLCDLASGEVLASAGSMNPQIRFGEDLMSRVSYVMLNPGGEIEMTRVVRETIDGLVADLCKQIDDADSRATPDDVLEMTFVGNPIMHHLLLGISPAPLGTAPFALATDGAVTLRARELDLSVHPGARAYLLPCIAGHVGADTSGMLIAETPWDDDVTTLLVDVGTNAEIVLADSGRILVASSPTGPAFEGAQISCGQRAAPGAIERVRIDSDSLEPRFKVVGCDLWSDDEGFDEALGPEGVTGLCGTGIIEAIAELFLAGVIDAGGRIDAALAERSARIEPDGRAYRYVLHAGIPAVTICQGDVRAVQLAKAALYAGVRLLMNRMGVERVERIRLAGAFGSHIDGKYAMVLGMIPDCDLGRVSSAGNAAGTGAVMALLDSELRDTIESRVRQVEKIETAVESAFQENFVNAMDLPHSKDGFPELAKQCTLPPREPRAARRGARRRNLDDGAG